MARRDDNRAFVEAVARGLDVLRSFGPARPTMTLSEVAEAAELARPTASRILYTLESLGYVRSKDGSYALTPRVLELGMTYLQSMNLWDIARPHMEGLSAATGNSSSMAQLDGSDIVYVARAAVPKIIALGVSIGTRFPAASTSLGKALLADLPDDEVRKVLSEPSRSGIVPRWEPTHEELVAVLDEVRAQGWALTDEQLAPGIRSVAAPVRGRDGRAFASLNVTVHAAETPVSTLLEDYLPLLLQAAAAITADWTAYQSLPQTQRDRSF
ncbi:MAG: IclR family transcriptional regulator C-terminal domain-containing protein [Aeromicrobium sp.]